MEQALYDPEKAAPKRASRAPEEAEDPQVLARLMWIAWKTSGQYAEFFGGDGEKAAPQLVFDFVTVVERVIKEFDEGQPRDERGRWASAGGGAHGQLDGRRSGQRPRGG